MSDIEIEFLTECVYEAFGPRKVMTGFSAMLRGTTRADNDLQSGVQVFRKPPLSQVSNSVAAAEVRLGSAIIGPSS